MVRPGCGSLRSHKWFLVAHSPDTVLKAASITSELCNSNSGRKTKAKPCHETQTPVSDSLPVLLHIYFYDSLHYFKVFCLKDGLKCSLPSLQFILPAAWPQHTPRASGCSALCHGYYYFLHLPKCLSRASPRWIYFLMCYRSLRGSPFLGKAMSSISSGLLKALRSLSRNLWHWSSFSCGLRFNSFVTSLLLKKIYILITLILSLLYWECHALYHVL